jgi:hypothetical protein
VNFILFTCSLFNETFSITQVYTESNERMKCAQWIGKDVEESDRSLTEGTIPEFALKDRRKPWKTSFRIQSLRPRFEYGTSYIRNRSVNHSVMSIGEGIKTSKFRYRVFNYFRLQFRQISPSTNAASNTLFTTLTQKQKALLGSKPWSRDTITPLDLLCHEFIVHIADKDNRG